MAALPMPMPLTSRLQLEQCQSLRGALQGQHLRRDARKRQQELRLAAAVRKSARHQHQQLLDMALQRGQRL